MKDIKTLTSQEGMLKQLMNRSGVMLAYVTKKAGMPPKPNGSG
jgi:hypothetical protein